MSVNYTHPNYNDRYIVASYLTSNKEIDILINEKNISTN